MVTVRASRWLALDRGSRSPVEGLAGADGACARVLAAGVVDGLQPLVADAAEPLATCRTIGSVRMALITSALFSMPNLLYEKRARIITSYEVLVGSL